jgi:murein DD-endopeptidase MepM/ murein hydrolase activator NlpD
VLSVPALRRSLFAVGLAVTVCLPVAGVAIAVDGEPEADKPFIWPTSGRLTQRFGCTGFWAEPRRGSCPHFHSGIDIANRKGTPIVAIADGTIELVGWDPWLRPDPAWLVIINHGNGFRSLYAHMRAKPVPGIRKGSRVEQGQLIGLMDSTGRSTGSHLHFAVYRNGTPVNPKAFMAGELQRPNRPRKPNSDPCAVPDYSGVGAGLGGRTAILPKPDSGGACAG